MDTSNSPQKAAHLLDDLESIRKLLGDEGLQPPLLTEMVDQDDAQIPLLSDVISEEVEPIPTQIPLVGITPAPVVEKAPDALLVHLDKELRTAAQAIMQDVINDFAPHIETEIKRRLDAHMERLLAQHQS
ncbi:DNA polymerase III subunit chi [Pseudomonas sp. CCI3.1]|uniref:DNA polymerase III subunit chi n=1 Tax=Pseudomonas sp. CCI3.1 TaxID=3048618 RepID=UPI002AB4C263|nr:MULTISPECIES: DNA polymerase III subunit chi [unclassified Pseudomonas]MDY7582007.1 DNA polymerase III subunit chi [Pseudomonas sp. CCI3.1]MEB0067404.1 DNA polymerase III subunit chi [Pseudomonas sp. CCI3.1]MEB0074307.1 DNA polymerase III subunit chi [Pseudomonas sp. CCI1.4]